MDRNAPVAAVPIRSPTKEEGQAGGFEIFDLRFSIDDLRMRFRVKHGMTAFNRFFPSISLRVNSCAQDDKVIYD
jgi:hypothetical protein